MHHLDAESLEVTREEGRNRKQVGMVSHTMHTPRGRTSAAPGKGTDSPAPALGPENSTQAQPCPTPHGVSKPGQAHQDGQIFMTAKSLVNKERRTQDSMIREDLNASYILIF